MGITNIADLREMLNSAANEELRAKVREILEGLQNQLENVSQVHQLLVQLRESLLSAPMRVASLHADAQEALLGRISHLAKSASVEQVADLTAAYRQLPEPYSQSFDPEWPPLEGWHEDDTPGEGDDGGAAGAV